MWSLQQLIDEGKLVANSNKHYYQSKGCRIYLGGDIIDMFCVGHVERKKSHFVIETVGGGRNVVWDNNRCEICTVVVLEIVEPLRNTNNGCGVLGDDTINDDYSI